jgi:hypothetical protein
MTARRRSRWGTVPALFALFCQIFVLGLVPAQALPLDGVFGFDAAICRAGQDPGKASHTQHSTADCALCPVCQALAQGAGFVPPEPAQLPQPTVADTVPAAAPIQTLLGRIAPGLAQPRAPPLV